MGKQAINLVLAGSNYSFTIDSEAEEIYRLAEREVNFLTSEFQQHKIKEFTTKDYLAMAALKLAIVNINSKREGSIQQEEVDALVSIKEQIESYLNDMNDTK